MNNFKLATNEVSLWRIDLDIDLGDDGIQHYRRLLSADEVERADRFHFEKHRRRFIVARAATRQILGGYVGLPASGLVFSYGEKGKPELSSEVHEPGIRFNLSHSSEVALLAVTQELTVGVDIELVNPEFATQDIAERFFSPIEAKTLRGLPEGERAEAFFYCWTRKEAYIKALGEGLSVPLDSFDVAFGPGVPAALLSVRVDSREVSRWSMYDIEAADGYKAAVVVEGRGHRLRQSCWQPEL